MKKTAIAAFLLLASCSDEQDRSTQDATGSQEIQGYFYSESNVGEATVVKQAYEFNDHGTPGELGFVRYSSISYDSKLEKYRTYSKEGSFRLGTVTFDSYLDECGRHDLPLWSTQRFLVNGDNLLTLDSESKSYKIVARRIAESEYRGFVLSITKFETIKCGETP